MSFNVLLPNSVGGDGWWCYKMYSPRHINSLEAKQISEWTKRSKLIETIIRESECDVVCLQEVCADTFHNDFSFMLDLGYDKHEIYKKGRFRPATFWRSSRLEVFDRPIHRDRCLITAFVPQKETTTIRDQPTIENRYLWVANVHLQAGIRQSSRRCRQGFDCVDTIRKEQSKILGKKSKATRKSPPSMTVVFTGDMNVDGPECGSLGAIDQLLLNGHVGKDLMEA